MRRYDQAGRKTLVALGTLGTPRTSPSTYEKPRPNVAVGALIANPAEVRERMNSVNLQVNSLDSEIKTNVTRAAFLSTWDQFRGNWQKFYDDNQSYAKILFTGTGTVERKANEYQAQLSNWYSALKQENPNAQLRFPPPLPPTAPPTGSSVPWWGISILTLLSTGALIYGTYASYLYVQEARRKKKFLEDEVVPLVIGSRTSSGRGRALASAFNQSRSSSREDDPGGAGVHDSYTRVHTTPQLGRDPSTNYRSLSNSDDDDSYYVFPGGLYDNKMPPYPRYGKKHR